MRAGRLVPALVVASLSLVVSAGSRAGADGEFVDSQAALLTDSSDWLETVNFYRTASGLDPVTAEPSWVDGQNKHLTYLANTSPSLITGQYANLHTENPASPWYTPEGEEAAGSSNIGYGDADRAVIESWMTAPFHSIGVMRPALTRAAFARSSGVAMLDIIRGISYPAPAGSPDTVLFPGDSSQTTLTRFAGELPDPREGCAADWQEFRGLPIYAMLPTSPPTATEALHVRPDGSQISTGTDLCVQTGATFNSTDQVYGATGKSILSDGNVVLIIPRQPLEVGQHRMTIKRPGEADLTWSFTVVTAHSSPANPLADVVTRVAGGDRYETSVALSSESFAPGVSVVYLATGSGFADALAAGPVATGRGPVLLVRSGSIPAAIADELKRLQPQRIVIVGGGNVVDDSVLVQARQFTSGEVTRIAGADRYATAASLSASQYSAGVGVVFIATGSGFADALAGGPAAGQNGPVLLVRQDSIPAVIAAELTRLSPARIVVLGGSSAVSDDVVTALMAFTGGTVTRRAGIDRYGTSVAVSAASFQPGVPIAYLATGATYADALGAGALGGPLLLARASCVPSVVLAELARLNPGKIIVLGGSAALGPDVTALSAC